MSNKYRVFELAKEFKTDNKTVIDILKKNNIKVTNHFSSVEEDGKRILQAAMKRQNAAPAAEPQAPDKKPMAKKNDNAPKAERPEKKPVVVSNDNKTPKVSKAAKPNKTSKTAKPDKIDRADKPDRSVETSGKNRAKDKSAANQGKGGEVKREQSPKPGANQPKGQRAAEKREGEAKRSQRQTPRSEGGDNNNRRPAQTGNDSHSDDRRSRNKGDFKGNRAEKGDSRNDNRGGGRNENRGDIRSDNRGGNRNGKGSKGGKGGKNERGPRPDNRGENRPNRPPKSEARKNRKKREQTPPPKAEIAKPKHIKIAESIAVKDLASKMSCTAAEVVKKLFLMGVMATINQEIDYDTAALVAAEFGISAEELPPEVDPTLIPEIEDDPKSLRPRPPVVTVMGHVDHGKTSLLDVIRKTSVSAHEAGGITQRIGAYQVMSKDKKIVFLDTPGHEAFTAMRARGAQVTDIAILVVAADDGVMPQTVEAINHAKSAGVPIIVAINKIDKPGANPDRVKQELMEHGLVSEEYGGDTIMVPVSAKQKQGIGDLLEMVLLVAEMQELKANPNREARGVIIEAQLDKGRGPVATVLVQSGTLRIGDSIVAGTSYGKVRAMANDRGDSVKKAGPSVPVEVLGFNDVPAAGDLLAVLEEKQARSVAAARLERQRTQLIKSKKVSLDDLFQQIQEGSIKDLNIVIKADVQGSVEALNSSLLALNKNDEVRVSIVHSGVGAVNESDVMLASAANALIIAFNVKADANAQRVAGSENIDIRTYSVIYDALNDVKDAMSGLLAPKYKEVIQGQVEIRKVMKFSKALVAGSYVLEGKICNNSQIRVKRGGETLFTGEIDSLRRFKDEVKEVAAGYECGISLIDYKDFQEGDIIEAFTMEEIETSIAEANKEAAKRREEEAQGKADSLPQGSPS